MDLRRVQRRVWSELIVGAFLGKLAIGAVVYERGGWRMGPVMAGTPSEFIARGAKLCWSGGQSSAGNLVECALRQRESHRSRCVQIGIDCHGV